MPTTYFRKLPLQMNVVCKENWWWLFVFPYFFCQSELITHVGWICSSGVWWQRGSWGQRRAGAAAILEDRVRGRGLRQLALCCTPCPRLGLRFQGQSEQADIK